MSMLQTGRSLRRLATIPLTLTLLSCSGDAGSGSSDTTAPDVGADNDVDQDSTPPPDLGTFDGGADIETDADDDSDAGADGAPCNDASECESGVCLDLTAGQTPGICTTNCTSDLDCPDGWDCTLLSSSGQDAIQVCIPVDYCADADGDNFGVGPGCRGQDCNDSDERVNLSADEVCDGIDNDCDEEVDENAIDVGDDCTTGFGGGCDPGRQQCIDGSAVCVSLRPQSVEVCDNYDNDCDEEVDEDASDATLWYRDIDNDRFGDPNDTVRACAAPEGYVAAGGDCDDNAAAVNPNAVELCDGVDNNCDGNTDLADAVGARTWYQDFDEDTFGNPAVSVVLCNAPAGYVADSDDCDDLRNDVRPTALELCDGIDNNCDGDTDEDSADDAPRWYADSDEDGFGDTNALLRRCLQPDGYVADNTDCDDERDNANPAEAEICDSIDNDCDDLTDEPDAVDAPIWYADTDDDGFGDSAVSAPACSQPTGFVANSNDCDDERDDVYPEAAELCDGVDNDCDDLTDEDGLSPWYEDADEDEFGDPTVMVMSCGQPAGYVADNTDCAPTVRAINPAATEVCDTVDNDCDTLVDEPDASGAPVWYEDADNDTFGNAAVSQPACTQPDGYVANDDDCDDGANAINPLATELCDGVDNDCDRSTDENDADDATTWYRDFDTDGFGESVTTLVQCTQPVGYVANDDDCNDRASAINPETPWYRDLDNDTFGDPDAVLRQCTQPAGYVADDRDCQPSDSLSYPGAPETCDNVDNDCDTQIDEGVVQACYTGPAGTAGVGLCRVGTQICGAGVWGACAGQVVPTTEMCDGRDNDCDGPADEGNPGGGLTCSTGSAGVCETGTTACVSGATACIQNITASAEICDGLDNNCNGSTDEGNPGSGFGCNTGLFGVCSAGTTTCSGGSIACNQTVFPAAEVCDGIDNDCDGTIDNGNPGGGAACSTGQFGVCAAGTVVCSGGQLVCQRNVGPSAEICDNIDNDCDNAIDEDFNKNWWWDRDADGFGDPTGFLFQCSQPNAFYVQNGSDANDFTQFIHPGRTEICDGVDNDQDGATDEDSVCANPAGGGTCTGRYDSGLNRGYMFCRASSNRNRDAHRSRCTGKGLDLAYPNDATENEFIRNTAENGGVFSGGFGIMWFGVQRRNSNSGNWFWIANNIDQGYTNFRSGEPSGDGPCAEMSDNGRWNDVGCGNNRDEAVCEWPAENTRRF